MQLHLRFASSGDRFSYLDEHRSHNIVRRLAEWGSEVFGTCSHIPHDIHDACESLWIISNEDMVRE